MIKRDSWLKKIESAWKRRPIIWLSGVRRVGKTTLTNMLPDATYVNCDLPSASRATDDPELFLQNQPNDKPLILDEVHQLKNPSKLLKIAADEYSYLQIIATGSSTLAATQKFKDSLTGRKHSIHLTPVLWDERKLFGGNLDHRLLNGGLPEALLAEGKAADYYSEWIDSFFARDIQELFGFRNRTGFISLFRLLLKQSGGQMDYSKLAGSIDSISRPTVISHISAMEIAHAIFLLRPFSGGGKREIVSRPKCYAFDTGFVSFEKGWDTIRAEDRGLLWEHLVLDSLRFRYADDDIFYWKDKSDREVDFVVRRGEKRIDLYECKINPEKLQLENIRAFRGIYPVGENFLVSPTAEKSYKIRKEDFVFTVCSTDTL
ncbi:MAG: ATP-binding protein [Pyrinomonadaceae bacterium]